MTAHVEQSIVIDAPIQTVWERMMDVESWPSLFTEYERAEILERDGNRVTFRLTTYPDPAFDGRAWSWVSERVADPASYSSRSRRIETGPFEHMNIRWQFETVEHGTRMRWVQDFAVKPEAPFDDQHAEQRLARTMTEQMRVIKERIEAAG